MFSSAFSKLDVLLPAEAKLKRLYYAFIFYYFKLIMILQPLENTLGGAMPDLLLPRIDLG